MRIEDIVERISQSPIVRPREVLALTFAEFVVGKPVRIQTSIDTEAHPFVSRFEERELDRKLVEPPKIRAVKEIVRDADAMIEPPVRRHRRRRAERNSWFKREHLDFA